MNSRSTVLGSGDMDGRGVEVDLLPADIHELADPQGMPEGHQDQEPVANRVAAVAGSGEQALDLAFRQVLALRSTASYCRRALVASYRACSSANSI